MSNRTPISVALAALVCFGTAQAQTNSAGTANDPAQSATLPSTAPVPVPEPPPPPPAPAPADTSGLAADIKAYYTAPLRWDGGDWAWFGAALVAVGAAHHYDSEVRTHFVKNLAPGQSLNSNDVGDAIPTAAVLVATWGYASLIRDTSGHEEAWTMLEAAGLGSVTAYAMKFAVGRQAPDQTDNANQWFKGGSGSFPSWHSTAAFAVGGVLAESGNDEYRWLRRLLGYGLGAATSYERLKHNAHWLSDTMAGAALGIASARFAMNRRDRHDDLSGFTLEPVPGGAVLAYHLTIP